MQIRQKGKRILLIRTEYVPEKKRTYGRTVASINYALSNVEQLDEETRAKLDPKEEDQLQAWFDDRQTKNQRSMLKFSLETLPTTLKECREALSFEGADPGMTADWVKSVYEELPKLRRKLKDKGYHPSKQTDKKPVDNRTKDMFEE